MPLDPRIGLAFQPTQYLDTGALISLAAMQDRRRLENQKWNQGVADEAMEAYVAAYDAAPGSDEQRHIAGMKAKNDKLTGYWTSGQGAQHGWNEQQYNRALSTPVNYPQALYRVMGPEKASAKLAEARGRAVEAKAGPQTTGNVVEFRQPPVKGLEFQPPLSETEQGREGIIDPRSGAMTRPLSSVGQPFQTQEIQPGENLPGEKTAPAPITPHEVPREETGTEGIIPAREITTTPAKETTEGLREAARREDKLARDIELGGGAQWQIKRHSDKAEKYRADASKLEGDIFKEERLGLEREKFNANDANQKERLRLAVQRANATQSPLDPRNVKLLGEAVAKGNYAIATGLARNQVAQRQLKDAVGDYAREHGWSADDLNRAHMKFTAATKAQIGFAEGPEAKNITAINTAIGHMGTMSKLADALAGGDVQAINAAVNAISNQFGNPSITNFEIAKSAVANELMRVFRQVGASETEVQEWEKKFSAAQTPDQIRGGLNTASQLLHSRINALKDQAQRAGIEIPEILSPEASTALGDIQRKSGERSGRFPKVKPFENPDEEKEYQEWKKNQR